MSSVIFPQALLGPLKRINLTQALDTIGAQPFGPGWSAHPIEHNDGWMISRDITATTLHAIFAPQRIPWVHAFVEHDRTFVFWPVTWHSYGDNPDDVFVSRDVFARASRARWFRNTLYHHHPTHHQALQAIAHGGIMRRTYPVLPR